MNDSGNVLIFFLSSMDCFGFCAKAFAISAAETLQDLDKNSIGSIGVSGWAMEDFRGAIVEKETRRGE